MKLGHDDYLESRMKELAAPFRQKACLIISRTRAKPGNEGLYRGPGPVGVCLIDHEPTDLLRKVTKGTSADRVLPRKFA